MTTHWNENEATSAEPLSLEAKVDNLTEQVAWLVERQRRQADLFEEAGPIMKAMMGTATGKLQDLEERGYFRFGGAAMDLMDRLVTSYGEDDVRELGDNLVTILDTVRALTQPQVLAVAAEATEVLHHPEKVKPMGMLGVARASSDEDVQRGMAMLIEVLRHLGRAAKELDEQRQESRRYVRGGKAAAAAPPRVRTPAAASAPKAAAAPAPAKGGGVSVDGVAFDANGFLADPNQWTRDLAVTLAVELGVGELTDAHWQVLDFARNEFLTAGASPNIRRISQGSGVQTREIYDLFKKAPGKTIARIAGIPKPVGCI